MSRESLSDRFRVDIGHADGGSSFVRVNDTVTGMSRTQVGFDGEPADAIIRRLASQIIAETGASVSVAKVFMVDICRDGGSYSLCFYSTDGDWYEFLVPIEWDGEVTVGYQTPRLYFRSANDGNVVRAFAWHDAQRFVASIAVDDSRFRELVSVVQNRGRFPPNEISSS